MFGPLSAWLAVARERSAAIWFAFGLLLGPIAPLLIALAPPGRCRVCGERSRGWLDTCQACGSPLDGSTRVAVAMAPATRTGSSSTAPIIIPAGTPPATRSGANLAAVGAVSATAVQAPPKPAAAAASSHATSRAGETEILATGVFVGGSVHLSLGARYAIARRKRTFEVRGPVDIAPGILRLEHPMAGLDATVVADRLVVTEKTAGRPKFVMVFQALSVQDDIDLESAFGTRRRPRARAAGS